MNKAEMIATFEKAYQSKLIQPDTVVADVVDKYTMWLREKIKVATSLMQTDFIPQEASDGHAKNV